MSARLIAIGVCTFRRETLADTLGSLARQHVPKGAALRIIVADNDDSPTAAGLVAKFAARTAHGVEYLHAPARNIAVARNAILEAAERAGAARLAFIDDDEIAAPDWLARLDARMTEDRADAVMGPVRATYRPGAPEWMQAARAHDTWPETGPDGRPIAGHSCNAMIDCAAPAFAGLRFDPARGRSGGEDSAWFEAARSRGARLSFARDALVSEEVPDARARLGWLLRRRYRMGQTYASLHYADATPTAKAARFAVALAKAAWCMAAATVQFPSAKARNGNIVRAALHVGVMANLVGLAQPSIYGAPDTGQTDRPPMAPNTPKGSDRYE
ncbi:glycosyltransferase [Phaeovulum sp.]|uniref:glycosyltransferase n=1 Tax=Phaeovulum sp. TaxID=2934796 RepID=UPI0039E38270